MVADSGQDQLALDFVQFSVDSGVLRFGGFTSSQLSAVERVR